MKYDFELKQKTILVTGAAGFIGASLILELFRTQPSVKIVGIDNLNDYYDVSIKKWRLDEIEKISRKHPESSWTFVQESIANKKMVDIIFTIHKPDIVVNMAAQAGVRYSITNPDTYIESNLIGFYNILEACRHSYDNGVDGVKHLVYASSSSVYGSNKNVPYSTTGLRFFTVYGPAGRPDMAYFGFTNKLRNNETIRIFNYGNCKRDFTYVDDIVEGVKRVMQEPPEKKTGEDGLPIPPYAVYNIGNSSPENLLDFVMILQEELIRAEVYDFESHKLLVPMQPGDVAVTYADTSPFEKKFGFKPRTSLRYGLRRFSQWYKDFYDV